MRGSTDNYKDAIGCSHMSLPDQGKNRVRVRPALEPEAASTFTRQLQLQPFPKAGASAQEDVSAESGIMPSVHVQQRVIHMPTFDLDLAWIWRRGRVCGRQNCSLSVGAPCLSAGKVCNNENDNYNA